MLNTDVKRTTREGHFSQFSLPQWTSAGLPTSSHSLMPFSVYKEQTLVSHILRSHTENQCLWQRCVSHPRCTVVTKMGSSQTALELRQEAFRNRKTLPPAKYNQERKPCPCANWATLSPDSPPKLL